MSRFISIDVDLMPLSKWHGYVADETLRWAASDALSRGASHMRKVSRPVLSARAIPIKPAMVGRASSVIKAGKGQLSAALRMSDNWMHAYGSRAKLSPRSGRGGASFVGWNTRQVVKGGFKATVRGRFTSIFVRGNPKYARRVGPNRSQMPIYHVGYGPSIAKEMIRTDHGANAGQTILKAGAMHYSKRFSSNLDRVMKHGKAKFGL